MLFYRKTCSYLYILYYVLQYKYSSSSTHYEHATHIKTHSTRRNCRVTTIRTRVSSLYCECMLSLSRCVFVCCSSLTSVITIFQCTLCTVWYHTHSWRQCRSFTLKLFAKTNAKQQQQQKRSLLHTQTHRERVVIARFCVLCVRVSGGLPNTYTNT